MKYYEFLELKRQEILSQLEALLQKYKVQPVGSGYIDCIVRKDILEEFVSEVNKLGILIYAVSWWCYVNPDEPEHIGCPHGMGGPYSDYYPGWFSELQNNLYGLDEQVIDSVLESYDEDLISRLNFEILAGIKKKLEIPFKYTPTDYIKENRCLTPALWLFVPDHWER